MLSRGVLSFWILIVIHCWCEVNCYRKEGNTKFNKRFNPLYRPSYHVTDDELWNARRSEDYLNDNDKFMKHEIEKNLDMAPSFGRYGNNRYGYPSNEGMDLQKLYYPEQLLPEYEMSFKDKYFDNDDRSDDELEDKGLQNILLGMENDNVNKNGNYKKSKEISRHDNKDKESQKKPLNVLIHNNSEKNLKESLFKNTNPKIKNSKNLKGKASCQKLSVVTTGCKEISNLLGMKLNEEKHVTCMRHDACYRCTFPFMEAMQRCDDIYLDDSARHCSKDMNSYRLCMKMAHDFLALMQGIHVRSNEITTSSNKQQALVDEACEERCVQEFIR